MIPRCLLPLLAMGSVLTGAETDDALRLGEEALAAGLWEIAAGHFETRMADSGLDEAAKSLAAVRLAEAKLRDGRADEALALLETPPAAAHPEAPFWKGQALAAMGEHAKAIETLASLTVDPLDPFHAEAVFTTANLELALGENSAALGSLGLLENTGDPALAAKARLRKAEMLLDMGRVSAAREALPPVDAVQSWDVPVQSFLDASIMLKEDRAAEAAVIFRGLIEKPPGQTYERHHLAAVGLAKALLTTDQHAAAANFVISFLQDHPETPRLDELFQMLTEAAARNPETSRNTLEALAQWTASDESPDISLIAQEGAGAVAAWPTAVDGPEITAHALFARAMILRRAATPEALMECRRLLNRVWLEFSSHTLAARSLYELAMTQKQAGNSDASRRILDRLKDFSPDSPLRGRAAFDEARMAIAADDRDAARLLFDEAARHLPENEARAARFNASVLILAENEGTAEDDTSDPETAAEVRLERALSRDDAASRIAAIEEFLIAHPDHSRAPEARLAAAEAALSISPPDISMARAQLDTLAAAPEKSAALDAGRLAMVRLMLADLGGEAETAIALARGIGNDFPGTPAAADAAFILGRNLFQTEAYNEARMVLEQVAAGATDRARADASLLLAARAAALVPTSQSQQDALALFRKLVDGSGPLAQVARLESSRLMIDMNRLEEAAASLRKWFDSLEKSDPMRLPAGLLLGEAIYARGSAHPESLQEALAVYDSLIADAAPRTALFNRLQYLRGRTLEQIPNERAAFSAYYSVLETEGVPAEWHHFESCGFRALALLEKARRWPAAIACARKIASFNGPRAAEATERASQLQLSHMIWED